MLKKLIFITAFTLSTPLLAQCPPDVGTPLTGGNGNTYCISNIAMNWWSAHSWCRAIGGHLATVNEACDPVWTQGSCPNISTPGAIDAWIWTATPSGNNRAWIVNPNAYNWGRGSSDPNGYRKDFKRAFCLIP